jgi:hypothetical protein
MRLRLAYLFVLALISFGFSMPVRAAGVVGSGSAGSCTYTALVDAVNSAAATDTITFNCGGAATITMTDTLNLRGKNLTIDGGGQITLQGTPGKRIIYFDTWGFNAARTVTLKNMTITGGSISGEGENANGAAIQVKNQSANWNEDLPTLIIDNVTFSNNVSTLTASTTDYAYDFGGGAIYILGGILQVNNSTFTNNTVNGGTGGAIHGLGSSIQIKKSNFSGNTATLIAGDDGDSGFGGVLYVDGTVARGGGSVKITKSTFENNSGANQGGVMYVNLYNSRNETLQIKKSRFIGNNLSGGKLGFGGAISGGGTGGPVTVKISGSVFANNTANGQKGGDGGAVGLAQAVNLTISNSTFHNNYAALTCSGSDCFSGRGGGLFISGGATTFSIINSTIANNRAGWFAGGIISSGNGTLINTLIANNVSEERGGTPNFNKQCSATYGGRNNLQYPSGTQLCTNKVKSGDPLLGSFSNDVLPLTTGSAAINAGHNSTCAAKPIKNRDQRGVARPQGKKCDIGSFELEGAGQ